MRKDEAERIRAQLTREWRWEELAKGIGASLAWLFSAAVAVALVVVPAPTRPLLDISPSLSWPNVGLALLVLAGAVFALLLALLNASRIALRVVRRQSNR